MYRTYFFLIKPKTFTNFPNFTLSKNSKCFGHFLGPSSGAFYCTFDIAMFFAGLMTASKKGQDDSAWKLSSNLQEIYQCRMYSRKLLMMGKEMPKTCIIRSFLLYIRHCYISCRFDDSFQEGSG